MSKPKTKTETKNTVKAKQTDGVIRDIAPELAALLPQYKLDDFETRSRWKGGDRLYIRLARVEQV